MYSTLFNRICRALRRRHRSFRTEQSYTDWIYRFIMFHGKRHPGEMGETEVSSFLSFLTYEKQVSAATQNQALQALLFLYRHVLHQPLSRGFFPRAKKSSQLPLILSRQEVQQVLAQLQGEPQLMVNLLYGSGLQLKECLTLRIQNIDFDKQIIKAGKEKKARDTLLPLCMQKTLTQWIEHLWSQYELWLQKSSPNIPDGHAQASCSWSCQYLFPAQVPSFDPHTGVWKFYHRSESFLQKAVKCATERAEIDKPVSCQTFRHSFAAHLLEDGHDIRRVQQLLGHADVRTTMIYTHVLAHQVRISSPLDRLMVHD